MKLIVEGLELSDAVLKVVKACATRTTLPVLECIKLTAKNDSLILTATDGEISMQKRIKADILEEGDICVPGKMFADFIKKLEGVQITLSVYNKTMDIIYADSQTSIQTLSAEDFPKVDTDIKENSFTMKTEVLKKVIDKTCFCCATDDSRPILKGCHFVIDGNTLYATALDGFRLADMQEEVISATGSMDIVFPARTLLEIDKMLPPEGETQIFIQKGIILVAVEDTVLTSRLYTGDFIKKENIIPTQFETTVIVNRETLKQSIERAAILVRADKNSLIIMDISNSRIEITSNSELGNLIEQVKADVSGKDLKIAMNSKFITDAINALDEEEIVMSFNSSVQPFICQNEEKKEVLYLILPVRTSNNA